jgi:REP element-mobilizing transposase RayT
MARAEVFDPAEIAVVHVMARTVRRCFLLGADPVSRKNFDHRRDWIEIKLQHLAATMGIDLLGFALMSNHFHLVLRSRPEVVETWNDEEVARRWLVLCPLRKIRTSDNNSDEYIAAEPTTAELNAICKNPIRLAQVRRRLSDISWWMRLLCQHIAQRANREEGGGLGKFWQSRFKAIRILDEATLLACSAYVDLNPIRAAMAQSLEDSQHTSAKHRFESIEQQAQGVESATCSDGFLAPVCVDEVHDPIGPHPSSRFPRCSDKGFLSMSALEYLQLLDWTARQVRPDKPGSTPDDLPPILDRLRLEPKIFTDQVRLFGRMFSAAAGQPQTLSDARSLRTHRRYYVRPLARTVFATAG